MVEQVETNAWTGYVVTDARMYMILRMYIDKVVLVLQPLRA